MAKYLECVLCERQGTRLQLGQRIRISHAHVPGVKGRTTGLTVGTVITLHYNYKLLLFFFVYV
jgi:hypothetical protein